MLVIFDLAMKWKDRLLRNESLGIRTFDFPGTMSLCNAKLKHKFFRPLQLGCRPSRLVARRRTGVHDG